MTTGDEPSIGGDKRIGTNGVEHKLGGEAAILHMVEMLEHPDRKVRYRAALKLAESGDDRVFDTLIDMLQDGDATPHWRERVAMALGQLGDERAIEPLLTLGQLTDERAIESLHPPSYLINPDLVIRALGQIGGDRAVDAIEEMFYCHWHGEWHHPLVVPAISEIPPEKGSQRVVEFLVNALTNETSPDSYPYGLGGHTVEILSKMGSQIVEPLLPLLNHESSQVRILALAAMREISDERLVEPLIALLDDNHPFVVREAVNALGAHDDERVFSRLIDFLDHPDSFIAGNAAKSLGMIGDKRAVIPLVKMLNSTKDNLKFSAIKALTNIGTDEALDAVFTTIMQTPAARDYIFAISALEESRDPRAVEPLITIMLNHPDPDTQIEAAELAARFSDKRITEALVKLLGEQNVWVRRGAALSLIGNRDSQAVEPLIDALLAPDSGCNDLAAIALGGIGDKRAVEPLISVLQNDQLIDRWVISALGMLGDQRAVEPLLALLTYQGSFYRAYAAEALGRLGYEHAVEYLIELVNDFGCDGCAHAAIALGELGDERAVGPLKNALYWADREISNLPDEKHDHADSIFRMCRNALEQIGTPEALAAIEDLPFQEIDP